MNSDDPIFVIPTYRLRDVAETVEKYDEHFWSNGHSVKMIVFDDSSYANHEKYYPLLEQTKTVNDVYYVGPKQKEQFLTLLNKHLRDRKLESLVRNPFRPSYGGNRNFTLMYTLGAFMISADDDMRPHALVESSPESLNVDGLSRGKLLKAGSGEYFTKSFDLLTAFQDVLGREVADLPGNYEKGELVIDTAMDLETNVSTTSPGTTRRCCKGAPFHEGRSSKWRRHSEPAQMISTRSTSCICTFAMTRSTRATCMILMICMSW